MAAIAMNDKPRRHPEIRYSIVPEGALLVHHSKGELKTLNPVGGFILDLLDGTRTVDEVVGRVAAAYQVERAEAERDTLAFLEELAAQEIVPELERSRMPPVEFGGRRVVVIAVVVVSIAPFTIRNYIVYGQFLLLNSNAGYAMYSAQNPMQGIEFREFDAVPIPAELAGQNEAQLDNELMRRGIGFVLAEPGRYLALSLSRVVDYFQFWPTADTSLINNIGRVGSFGLFLPFMLIGLWLAFRSGGPRSLGSWRTFAQSPLALTSLFMLVYSALHIFTWAMPRYRLPVDAVALPLAALAMLVLIDWVRVRVSIRPLNLGS